MCEVICTKCGQAKSPSAFSSQPRKSNGLDSWCKSCQQEAATAWAHKNPGRVLLHDVKGRCKRAGIPFNLEPQDIVVPEVCPILGIKLSCARGKGASRDNSPSLDRIIPKKGYMKGNVIVVSFKANRIKSNATADEILAVGNFYKELSNV